jgi:hypothetical protein
LVVASPRPPLVRDATAAAAAAIPQLDAARWREAMAADLDNTCGGSAYKLESGSFLVAFTAMSDALATHDENRTREALAWEARARGRYFLVLKAPPDPSATHVLSIRVEGPPAPSATHVLSICDA